MNATRVMAGRELKEKFLVLVRDFIPCVSFTNAIRSRTPVLSRNFGAIFNILKLCG
jgi:hypothetical protein